MLQLIGLDAEWVMEKKNRKKIALLQLSTIYETILVRLFKIAPDGILPEELKSLGDILKNPK